jgi:hypothetical protein
MQKTPYLDREGDAESENEMRSFNTKLVLSALGIAAMLTSPAFAQRPQRQHSHPTVQYQGASDAVQFNGVVVGSDPDPQIRSELSRDAGNSLGAY